MLPGSYIEGVAGAFSAKGASLRWAVYAGPLWKPTKRQWEKLMDLQQEEERARMKRFFFERDAKLACVGRLMLHAAAVSVLGADPKEVRFGRNKENKPYLLPVAGKEKKGFNLNLSHHGEWVVLATEDKCLVGSDVMTTTLPRANEAIETFFADFDTTFTKEEWETIRGAGPEAEQLVVFFCHWALKESYLKATGIGLGIELTRIRFTLNRGTSSNGLLEYKQRTKGSNLHGLTSNEIRVTCFSSGNNLIPDEIYRWTRSARDADNVEVAIGREYHSNLCTGFFWIDGELEKYAVAAARKSYNTLISDAATVSIDGKPMPSWSFEIAFVDCTHIMAVGLGPFTQAYSQSKEWPHISAEDWDTKSLGLGLGGKVDVKQVEDLLSEDVRAEYLVAL